MNAYVLSLSVFFIIRKGKWCKSIAARNCERKSLPPGFLKSLQGKDFKGQSHITWSFGERNLHVATVPND